MAGSRALFASIGAGVTLTVAAALSLLAISAVFAFGGWSDSVSQSVTRPALVFAGANSSDPEAARTVAAVNTAQIVAPAPRPRRSRPAATRNRPSATALATTSVSAPASASAPEFAPPVDRRPANVPAAAAPATQKSGDHVRKAGDSLSATVQNAGSKLSETTAPLSPPVSAAVQQVLNLVAEIVRRAADGLGSTLDTLLPK